MAGLFDDLPDAKNSGTPWLDETHRADRMRHYAPGVITDGPYAAAQPGHGSAHAASMPESGWATTGLLYSPGEGGGFEAGGALPAQPPMPWLDETRSADRLRHYAPGVVTDGPYAAAQPGHGSAHAASMPESGWATRDLLYAPRDGRGFETPVPLAGGESPPAGSSPGGDDPVAPPIPESDTAPPSPEGQAVPDSSGPNVVPTPPATVSAQPDGGADSRKEPSGAAGPRPQIPQWAAGLIGMADGGLLSMGDEGAGLIAAGLQSGPTQLFYEFVSGRHGEAMRQYEQVRNVVRNYQKAAQEQHPWTYQGGNIVGSVVTPGLGLLKGASKGVEVVDSVGRRVVDGVKRNAAQGAASGFGEGETWTERSLRGVANGALAGVLGGATSGALYKAADAGLPIAGKLHAALMPENEAAIRLAAAHSKDMAKAPASVVRLTEEQIAASAKKGAPILVIDHGGKEVRGLAHRAARDSDEARVLMDRVLEGRTDSVKNWLSKALNFSDEKIRQKAIDESLSRSGARKERIFGAGNAFEAGENFVSGKFSTREMLQTFGRMTDLERELFQDGFISRATQALQNKGNKRIETVNRMFSDPDAVKQIQIAVGKSRANELEAMFRVDGIVGLSRRAVRGTGQPMPVSSVLEDLFTQEGIDRRVAKSVAKLLMSDDQSVFKRGIRIAAQNERAMKSLRKYSEKLGDAVSGQTLQFIELTTGTRLTGRDPSEPQAQSNR